MGKICGYVLRTHGPKSITDIRKHPSSRQQMINLFTCERQHNIKLADILCDYARHHDCLDQLPELRMGLEMALDYDATLLIDDLGRLFRTVPMSSRKAFLDELLAAGGRIAGLRHAFRLDEAPDTFKKWLILGGEPGTYVYQLRYRRRRPQQWLSAQTANATKASARARREQALARAQELAKIRDDLAQPETKPTLAAIAEAANAKGLRTGRGNPWTVSAVSQALARLGDSASDDAEAS